MRQWGESCRFYRETPGLAEGIRDAPSGGAECDLGGPCFGVERVDPDGNVLTLLG